MTLVGGIPLDQSLADKSEDMTDIEGLLCFFRVWACQKGFVPMDVHGTGGLTLDHGWRNLERAHG